MTVTLAHRKVAARLLAQLVGQGASPVEADILQPSETLLDLYGESIRHRAYVTNDPVKGEQMLRPDFTVPVVQMHMNDGAEPARYAYAGEVFRKQLGGAERPNEFLQVGYEVFDRTDPATADAEVFTTIRDLLRPIDLRATVGDIGVLRAAVSGLDTTDRRKAALERHIWRPRRFRALLDRFGGRSAQPEGREDLVAQVARNGADAMIAAAGPAQGVRSATEIAARLAALQEDVAAAPIPEIQVEVLEDILRLRETAPNALERLRDLAVDLPALGPALDRLAARLTALEARGVDVDGLEYDGAYGRASLEYYDGFVFGFYALRRPHLAPLASGGRYDALTAVLGQGRAIPAVGGIVRAGLVADLEGDA